MKQYSFTKKVLMLTDEVIIDQTKCWIKDVVIGCNFCPFAAKELRLNTIHYHVEKSTEIKMCLESFLAQCKKLDLEKNVATTLLIFPAAFARFDNFLNLVSLAGELLTQEKYEGIYQVASFHPLYCFANALIDDAANYTNRSIYPMLHILREDGIEKALSHYNSPEKIPANNIKFARQKGVDFMRGLRNACLSNADE